MAQPKEAHHDLWLIAGLGNPDAQYEHTRHNAGFDAIDMLADQMGVHYWKSECGAKTAQGSVAGVAVVLAKPQSYMNTSGGPIKKICQKYKISPDVLIVIHDDMDIDPGHIRVRFGGSAAGHNGLKSICDKLQTPDWYRVRVGTGHPRGRKNIPDYVLSRPKGTDKDLFDEALTQGAQAACSIISNGLSKTQQEFN